MMTTEQAQDYVLLGDAIAPRPFQVWVNGARVIQANGTNPKFSRANDTKLTRIAITEDRTVGQVYVVRIVKRGVTAAIVSSSTWEISFDGLTRVPCRVLPPIREHKVQGVAWEIDLELTRNV